MKEKYRELFNFQQYIDEQPIHFYKQINGEEVDSPVLIPETIFMRIKLIGQAYEMHYISMFELYDDVVFNKMQMNTLVEEIQFLQSLVDDPVMQHFLALLRNLSEEIIRSHRNYSLAAMGV